MTSSRRSTSSNIFSIRARPYRMCSVFSNPVVIWSSRPGTGMHRNASSASGTTATYFEHQIFWSEKTFDYLCDTFGLELRKCETVNHKYRRGMPAAKRIAISAYRQSARFGWLRRAISALFGVDPRLLPPPRLKDHYFVVVQKKHV